jgi:hypothetical protein
VLCDVYQLRSETGKLNREAVLASRRQASVEFGRSKSGAPVFLAWLRNDKGVAIDQLDSASIRFIRGDGVMIQGFQTIIYPGPTRFFTQSWWCVPARQ